MGREGETSRVYFSEEQHVFLVLCYVLLDDVEEQEDGFPANFINTPMIRAAN